MTLGRPREATQMFAVYDFIVTHIREKGLPPTRADIARHFAWSSPNSAESHLKALKRRGLVELVPGIARGIRVTAP